jgi:hypothetical protein
MYFVTANDCIASKDTWYHIAIVRYGTGINNVYAFVNGVSQTLTWHNSLAAAASMPDVGAVLTIGGSAYGGDSLNGWIDEVRISKGIARWTANFTAPTSAYSYNAYADKLIKREKYHLDSLGEYRVIKVRATHDTSNAEDVIFYGYNIMSYVEEYENE